MPRAEAGSVKAMNNKMKSVGLQKLRWYCQMCQKQCRDENGFKCHTLTEGHLRQMKMFAENSHGIIDDFSRDFCRGFIEILSNRHGTSRVQANKVYQEYIAFKEHIHMNATMWTSLTEFCIYLGKESKAVVDETEKGWFVQYIDRDPRLLARQAAMESKQKAELDDEERAWRMIQTQIQVAEQLKRGRDEFDDASAPSADEMRDIKVELTLASSLEPKKRKLVNIGLQPFDHDEGGMPTTAASADAAAVVAGPVASAPSTIKSSSTSVLEQLKCEDERRKADLMATRDKLDRRENWLHVGIVVRVMNKRLAEGRFYKLKGTVVKVIDDFIGEIRVDGALIRLDQAELETVLPKLGATVIIVNGRCRGKKATLLRIHEERFNCDVRVGGDLGIDLVLENVEYEDVSKLDTTETAFS